MAIIPARTDRKAPGLVRNRTQLSIYVVGAMLMADFVLFGYWPSWQRLDALEEARGRQQSRIRLADCHRRQLPDVQDRLVQCDRALAQYRDRVPANRDLGSFLQEVSGLMSEHHLQGIELKDQGTVPGTDADGLICIPLAIRCKGGLSDLFGFYRQFTSVRRLVGFEMIRFTNDPDWGGRVQMDATMVIYYRPQSPSEGRLEAI